MFGNSLGLNEILTQNVRAKSGLGPKFSQNMFGLSSGFLTYNRGSWFGTIKLYIRAPLFLFQVRLPIENLWRIRRAGDWGVHNLCFQHEKALIRIDFEG